MSHFTGPTRTHLAGQGHENQLHSALDYGDSGDNIHTYVKPGDVNLGAVFSIHKYDKVSNILTANISKINLYVEVFTSYVKLLLVCHTS